MSMIWCELGGREWTISAALLDWIRRKFRRCNAGSDKMEPWMLHSGIGYDGSLVAWLKYSPSMRIGWSIAETSQLGVCNCLSILLDWALGAPLRDMRGWSIGCYTAGEDTMENWLLLCSLWLVGALSPPLQDMTRCSIVCSTAWYDTMESSLLHSRIFQIWLLNYLTMHDFL